MSCLLTARRHIVLKDVLRLRRVEIVVARLLLGCIRDLLLPLDVLIREVLLPRSLGLLRVRWRWLVAAYAWLLGLDSSRLLLDILTLRLDTRRLFGSLAVPAQGRATRCHHRRNGLSAISIAIWLRLLGRRLRGRIKQIHFLHL